MYFLWGFGSDAREFFKRKHIHIMLVYVTAPCRPSSELAIETKSKKKIKA